jgi:predicted PurR-regulated permease PerM
MENRDENNIKMESKSIDLTLRIMLIAGLFAWCVMIILPFVIPVLWGIILAITLFPLYSKLLVLLRGRRVLASTITTGILLLLLIIPSAWLISEIVEGTGLFIDSLRSNTLKIPAPDPSVADWPVIGDPLYNGWMMLTTNLEATIVKYSEQILKLTDKLLGALTNFASGLVMPLLSIVIAGIFMASSSKSERSISSFASRIGGRQGEEFINIIILTIRNVAKGILGVAFIQFILLGAAFILAKVPFAGLWAVIVLLLAIVQLPSGIVGIPVMIYLFTTREPLPAVLWSVLIVLLSLSDNFLKPWLMGMGAPVPMIVIFLGAIGGMIMSGFIGLFTGAIILSLGYKLATMWMDGDMNQPAKQ